MKKLLNVYRTLKPEIRFRIVFYVLLSLIWIPVHMNTDVKVYEPYRYDIDDVEENQVVFACWEINTSKGRWECIWVIQKDGTCRRKDLTEETEMCRKRETQKHNKPEELTDEELLVLLDKYMKDETLPKTDKQFVLDEKTLNYFINISNVELRYSNDTAVGAGLRDYYVVCGTGKERRLKVLQEGGFSPRYSSDYKILKACDEIACIR